ncbi:MAG TPA: hypothetical protein VFL29_06310 [Candidatus Dormibacteraeota bacterium]|nr:hypothetical protein [Candidatus Dormibacteraeota bacterium]
MRRAARMVITAAAVVLAASPAAAHAFTLIQTTKVTVTPTSGYPTAAFRVDGRTSPCGNGPFTYTFYFDSNLVLLWNTSVGACVSNAYDTGLSPNLVPPNGFNAVGAHTIILTFSDANGGSGTTTTAYTINNPPPPPRPSPKPSPSAVRSSPPTTQPSPSTTPSTATSPNCPPGAVTAGCPSPTPSNATCPAAMLPPPGTGGWADNLIAGAMVLAVIPIAGLALFGPGPLWAAVNRRRRLLTLLGLSVVAVLTLNCTFPTNSTQPVANVSPSASPSCSA